MVKSLTDAVDHAGGIVVAVLIAGLVVTEVAQHSGDARLEHLQRVVKVALLPLGVCALILVAVRISASV